MFDYSTIFAGNATLASGLIHYFNFNETSGRRSHSSLSNQDSFIRTKQHDYGQNDFGGGVLAFNGTDTIRHIISNDVQNIAPEALSVSLRFQVTDPSENRTQILLDTGDGKNGFNIYLQNGELIVGAWSKGVWNTYLATEMPEDGSWHTVAFSYESDDSAGQINAYLDGTLFGSSETGSIGAFKQYITLGGTSGGTNIDGGQLPGGNRFAGQIDEIAVFDRGLSAEEIHLLATASPTSISGTGEGDILPGTTESEIIYGLEGDDWIVADDGNDTLIGGSGNDRLEGQSGTDNLFGGNGNDVLLGGNDNDRLEGGDGYDQLRGQGGNDTLIGGSTYDMLWGGGGDDLLKGDEDNDGLMGEAGNDTLDGGVGDADTAFYEGPRSDYKVVVKGDTTYVVSLSSDEGIDELVNVERIEFSDITLALNTETQEWLQEEENNNSGGTGLVDPGFQLSDGANPSVGINLAPITDYVPQGAFLNLMLTARNWGSIDNNNQRNNGDQEGILGVDENGWVNAVNDPNIVAYYTPFMTENYGGEAYEAGRYVVRYEGEATVYIDASFGSGSTGSVTIIENEPGRLVFDYTPGSGIVRLGVTDFSGNLENYVRNIEIVQERYEPLLDQGEIFDPDFLESLSGFNSIRFMNWMNVNYESRAWNSDGLPTVQPDADNLISPDYFSYSRTALSHGIEGVPVEIMVELANKTGTDPWFTIPFGATNEYIESFATYVHENLDPNLKAYFEYGNEVWNSTFSSSYMSYALGVELFGEDTWQPGQEYYAVDAARMSFILQTIWGDDPTNQLVTVISKQTTDNPALLDLMMNAPNFIALGDNVPEQFADIAGMSPHEIGFDALGITSYFFSDMSENREEVMAMVANDTDEEWANLFDRIIHGEDGLMQRAQEDWAEIAADARAYGLQLVGYEGNQHFRPAGNDEEYGDFLNTLFDRPEMGDLLTSMLETWRALGGGQLQIFQDVGGSDGQSRWGLRDHQLDTNTAMLDAVRAFSQNNGMWWGDERDISVFEDSLVFVSGPGQMSMEGGSRDDLFLVHDTTVMMINGGEGTDRVILPGNAADFTYIDGLITGPSINIQLTNIELLVFNDATIDLMS